MSSMGNSGGIGSGMRIGPASTPQVIKDIMLVTTVAFLAQWVLGYAFPSRGENLPAVIHFGALRPSQFWSGMLWQPVTTLLLHGEAWHLAGNMFFLWMFGCPVAEKLGRSNFLAFYVGAGIGGGVLNLGISLLFQLAGVDMWLFPWDVATIGAAGAVFAVVTYYCFLWPDRPISLLFLPLTFTARWLLPLEFLLEFSGGAGSVSHAAHLCGVVMGWWWFRNGGHNPASGIWRFLSSWRSRKSRSHLKVVSEDEESGPVFH